MASVQHTAAPRRKIATYGKAAKRRIPEYTFMPTARAATLPEEEDAMDSQNSADTIDVATPASSKATQQIRSLSRTPSSASPPTNSIDLTLSDDEAPMPMRKPTPVRAAKKPIQRVTAKRASPFTSPHDVFDFPSSEDDGPNSKPVSRASKANLAKSTAGRVTKQNTALQKPRPASKPVADVFDVPSSDVEAPEPKPRTPKVVRKVAVTRIVQGRNILEAASVMAEGAGDKKRVKLSPPNEISHPKLLPAADIARRPKAAVFEKPVPRMRPMSPKKTYGQATKVASRPKSALLKSPVQAPLQSRTPQKPSPSAGPNAPQEIIDVDMIDAELERPAISPKSMGMWMELLGSEDEESTTKVKPASPVRQDSRLLQQKSTNLLVRPAGIRKASQKTLKPMPRRRLIDTLVEQQTTDSSDESSSDEAEEDTSADSLQFSQAMAQMSRSQSLDPEANSQPPVLSDSQGSSQGMGLKKTYSTLKRSMLAEEDLMAELALDMPVPAPQAGNRRRSRMATAPPLLALTSGHGDEGEDGTAVAVKSVHELRKSGANNRFMDEMQDYLDRIGRPGKTTNSMRRSGLLELAGKMQDKTFVENFRANSIESTLFLHLGQETDIVAGFIMVSLLTSVLIDGNMHHIVPQLRRQGITRLLIRLLECESSLRVVAKDRKSNMSKVSQSMLLEHADHIMQLPAWEELKPQTISPRTMALKCLEVMVRQTRESGNSGEIFSKELTTNLFAIMKSASDESSSKLPEDKLAIDFFLALSALESHSIAARTVDNELIWINDYLPIIADTLEIGLARPAEDLGMLQLLLLRLTLNVTNNNRRASDVFARPKLLSVIGQLIVAKFKQILRFLTEDELNVALDHLILALGVMINFAEWSSDARESMQSLQGSLDDPLDAMAQTFTVNREKFAQADSMTDVSKNVAFGYLSVLLGYFSLLPAISQRIAAKHPRNTIRPLVASIEEFIGHHKAVDLLGKDEDGYSPQTALTERLENLVRNLAAMKADAQ